jgi:3-mercaptopyruvate sulfurtransferase SseA
VRQNGKHGLTNNIFSNNIFIMTTQNTPIQLKSRVARWRSLSPGKSPENQLRLVDAPTLKEWIDRDTVLLIDVREPAEHAGEHIPGSILLLLSKFDPTQMPTDPDKTLVLYCRTSNRSQQSA